MKERPKRKGLLVIALIAVLAVVIGIPPTGAGTSFAESAAAETEKPDHFAYIIGYPDGNVRPLGQITREETATIFYRLLTQELREEYASAEQPFTDVGGERWSYNAISALYQAGIIRGYADGSFLPKKPVSRAEFTAIAARFEGIRDQSDQSAEIIENEFADAESKENKLPDTETQEYKFPDLEGHWANQYVRTAVKKDWIRGYGDGTFRPDHFIIRCEAMMLVNEALDHRVNLAGLPKDAKQWPDNTEDKWYYEIVQEATNTHDYERADRPKSTEKWTGIRPDPIW